MLNVKDQKTRRGAAARGELGRSGDPGVGTDPGWRARFRARRTARSAGVELRAPTLPYTSQWVETSGGPVEVREIGSGPTLFFVHGLLVDGRVWDPLVEQLAGSYRCVVPTLPLGAHRRPMHASADQSPEGIAALLDEVTVALELTDATAVASDSGGAITQLWMDRGPSRVGKVVLTPCDCFTHFFPPAFRPYQWLAKVPRVGGPVMTLSRFRAVRHLPTVYGGLTHRRIDDALLRDWLTPIGSDRAVFRDTIKFLGSISSKRLIAAEQRLGSFDRPVLLAWAPEQEWFPPRHARRLAEILPDARVVHIADTGAFISLEQPAALAAAIREFVGS